MVTFKITEKILEVLWKNSNLRHGRYLQGKLPNIEKEIEDFQIWKKRMHSMFQDGQSQYHQNVDIIKNNIQI